MVNKKKERGSPLCHYCGAPPTMACDRDLPTHATCLILLLSHRIKARPLHTCLAEGWRYTHLEGGKGVGVGGEDLEAFAGLDILDLNSPVEGTGDNVKMLLLEVEVDTKDIVGVAVEGLDEGPLGTSHRRRVLSSEVDTRKPELEKVRSEMPCRSLSQSWRSSRCGGSCRWRMTPETWRVLLVEDDTKNRSLFFLFFFFLSFYFPFPIFPLCTSTLVCV